ncbi:MAG: hypothetical protein WDA32_00595 [Candidatus Caldatribacteriota bacterium]
MVFFAQELRSHSRAVAAPLVFDPKLKFNESFSDCVTCINKLLSSGLIDRIKLLRDNLSPVEYERRYFQSQAGV